MPLSDSVFIQLSRIFLGNGISFIIYIISPINIFFSEGMRKHRFSFYIIKILYIMFIFISLINNAHCSFNIVTLVLVEHLRNSMSLKFQLGLKFLNIVFFHIAIIKINLKAWTVSNQHQLPV